MQFVVEEAVEIEFIPYRVDVRKANEVADDRRHRRASPTRHWTFIGTERKRAPVELVRNLSGQFEQLQVDQEEAGEPVLFDQGKLSLQPPQAFCALGFGDLRPVF